MYKNIYKYSTEQDSLSIMDHVVSLIMLPLCENRDQVIGFVDNTKDIVQFYQKSQPQKPENNLTQFTYEQNG